MNLFDIIKNSVKNKNQDKIAMEYALSHGLRVGKNFQYNSGFPIDGNWPWLITIGDNVTLATGVKLLAHDASTAKIEGVKTKVGIVKIGNNVFIGCNTIVLPNVRIGDNVVVGAGSVVSHDIPSNSIYAGNPAHYICSFDEYATKHLKNQVTHPICREYSWREWPNASQKDWDKMRDKLSKTFGYL